MSVERFQYSPLQSESSYSISTGNSIINISPPNSTNSSKSAVVPSPSTSTSDYLSLQNSVWQNLHLDSINSSNIKNTNLDEFRSQIQLRFLCPNDINELKTLCSEWFPVDYPDVWYNDITSSTRFYSLAAIYQNRIIGMIVSEIKLKTTTDKEDWYILSSKHPENTQVTYILSLGVFKEYRRLGIASLLLDTLISYLKSKTDCKAIYLHVLCSNTVAIKFYEKRNFKQRIFLRNYYTIKGQLQDGHCFVLYMNDGQPPCTLVDCCNDTLVILRTYNPLKIFSKVLSIVTSSLRSAIYHLNRFFFSSNAKDLYRTS